MDGDEFVSLSVAIAVMEKYSYRPIGGPSTEEGLIFENFKKPFRNGLKFISFQSPNYVGPNGELGYRVAKLVHAISCTYGISHMGEVVATIRLTRQHVH